MIKSTPMLDDDTGMLLCDFCMETTDSEGLSWSSSGVTKAGIQKVRDGLSKEMIDAGWGVKLDAVMPRGAGWYCQSCATNYDDLA